MGKGTVWLVILYFVNNFISCIDGYLACLYIWGYYGQWTSLCLFYVDMFSILLDLDIGEELLGHMVTVMWWLCYMMTGPYDHCLLPLERLGGCTISHPTSKTSLMVCVGRWLQMLTICLPFKPNLVQSLKRMLGLNERIRFSFSGRGLVKLMLLCPNFSSMKSRMSDSLRLEFLSKSCDPTREHFRLVALIPRICLEGDLPVKDLSTSHSPGSWCQEMLARCRDNEAEEER